MARKNKFKKDGATWYRVPCSFCDKTIEFKHGDANKIKTCPHCSESSNWLLKPKTERKLFELQEKYFSTLDYDKWEAFTKEIVKKNEDDQNKEVIQAHLNQRDEKTLHEIYLLVFQYSESLIKKFLKTKGFTISRNQLQEHIQNVSFLFFENFTRKYNYKIVDSFAGFLNLKIIESMYSKKQKELDMTDSLDRIVIDGESSKGTEMGELIDKFDINPLFGEKDKYSFDKDTYDVVEDLKKVLELIVKAMDENSRSSRRRIMLALTALNLFLSKQDKKLANFFAIYGKDVKRDTENIKKQFRTYLRDLQREKSLAEKLYQ